MHHSKRTWAAIGLTLTVALPLAAQHKTHSKPHKRKSPAMVAYNAKDKRWYSVAWAKAHGMHDKGGDRLILIAKSKLPKDAKMSKAMLKK